MCVCVCDVYMQVCDVCAYVWHICVWCLCVHVGDVYMHVYVMHVCVHVCDNVCAHIYSECMWRSEDNFLQSVLVFHLFRERFALFLPLAYSRPTNSEPPVILLSPSLTPWRWLRLQTSMLGMKPRPSGSHWNHFYPQSHRSSPCFVFWDSFTLQLRLDSRS